VHRDAGRPTAADRERVTAALRARLGSVVLPLETPLRDRLMRGALPRRSATALGVCVVGSVLFLARRPSTATETAVHTRSQSVPAVLSSAPAALAMKPAASSPAHALPPPELAPAAFREATAIGAARHASTNVPPNAAQDTLGQEVLLLSSAMSQLHSGQAAGALVVLDEHQRRFSHGALSEERIAAKARALCMLRRFSESRAALALLAAESPIAARVKEACDATSSRGGGTDGSPNHERD
jgi:hypothetical protein